MDDHEGVTGGGATSPEQASVTAEYLAGPAKEFYAFLKNLLRYSRGCEFDGVAIDAVEADETGLHFVLADDEGGPHRRVTLVRSS